MCKDNVGYSVKAIFITQSESTEHTGKTLGSLFKCRGLGMSDYLEVELAPVQAVFPNTNVYLCDFTESRPGKGGDVMMTNMVLPK